MQNHSNDGVKIINDGFHNKIEKLRFFNYLWIVINISDVLSKLFRIVLKYAIKFSSYSCLFSLAKTIKTNIIMLF